MMTSRVGAMILLAIAQTMLGSDVTPIISLNPLQNAGFLHFYNNEYDEAVEYFASQVKARPADADQYNFLAQALLYREMFRDGALESQLVTGNNPFLRRAKMEIPAEDKQRFNNCLDQSLSLSEGTLAKNPTNIAALFSLGVAYGLRANYEFLVEKSWVESLKEAAAARQANQKILELEPKSVDAHLILGLDEYVVGCLPFYLRAVGALGGFHGDREGGIRNLELVSRQGVRNRYDAQILLAVIYRREHRSRQAIPLLQQLARTFPRNSLYRFEQVQMYSDLGDKTAAIGVVAEIEHLRASGSPGYASLLPQKVEYVRSNLLFWYGDLEPALTGLKQVTVSADKLDLNTAVLAWLRLGQIYDLQGDHKQAIEAYKKTMKAAPNSPVATEAKEYISSPYRRKRVTEESGKASGAV